MADCDTLQLSQVYGRERDDHGQLIRKTSKGPSVPGSRDRPVYREDGWTLRVKDPAPGGYKGTFWSVSKYQGFTEEQTEQRWQQYLGTLRSETRQRLLRVSKPTRVQVPRRTPKDQPKTEGQTCHPPVSTPRTRRTPKRS